MKPRIQQGDRLACGPSVSRTILHEKWNKCSKKTPLLRGILMGTCLRCGSGLKGKRKKKSSLILSNHKATLLLEFILLVWPKAKRF